MNVTKEQFIKLANENLFVLEGERNGNCSIYGIEQLYDELQKEYYINKNRLNKWKENILK